MSQEHHGFMPPASCCLKTDHLCRDDQFHHSCISDWAFGSSCWLKAILIMQAVCASGCPFCFRGVMSPTMLTTMWHFTSPCMQPLPALTLSLLSPEPFSLPMVALWLPPEYTDSFSLALSRLDNDDKNQLLVGSIWYRGQLPKRNIKLNLFISLSNALYILDKPITVGQYICGWDLSLKPKSKTKIQSET